MNRWQRLFKHLWLDAADSRRAVPAAAAQRLAAQVAASELRHSGEIRLCVEAALPWAALWPPPSDATLPSLLRQRALHWFGQLGVWDTRDNNGVLIYLQLAERAIEIVADRGLNAHVTPAQWQAVLARLSEALGQQRFEEGLAVAVNEVSALLERHFPPDPTRADVNELPDAVLLY